MLVESVRMHGILKRSKPNHIRKAHQISLKEGEKSRSENRAILTVQTGA